MNYILSVIFVTDTCTRKNKGKFFLYTKNFILRGEVLCVCMFSVCDV